MMDTEFERMEAGWLLEEKKVPKLDSADEEAGFSPKHSSTPAMGLSIWDYIEKHHRRSTIFFNFMYSPSDHDVVSNYFSFHFSLFIKSADFISGETGCFSHCQSCCVFFLVGGCILCIERYGSLYLLCSINQWIWRKIMANSVLFWITDLFITISIRIGVWKFFYRVNWLDKIFFPDCVQNQLYI